MEARDILAWNLRALRTAKGLSQERLALAAEIDRSYVGRVERSRENVTIATLSAFARVLEVPVAALLAEPPDGAPLPMPLRSGRKNKAAVAHE